MDRQYKTSASRTKTASTSAFGTRDICREFARRIGWHLGRTNLFVEGGTDRAYLELADKLYHAANGKHLIGSDFTVHALGEGPDGGTKRLDDLRVLWRLRQTCPAIENADRFRVIVLWDDDAAGRRAFADMQRWAKAWSDVFLLRRRFPIVTSPTSFHSSIRELNAESNSMSTAVCEIEDLLSVDLIELFLEENPRCEKRIAKYPFGFHVELGKHKGDLRRFVEDHATLEDVEPLVVMLKSFRSLLQLP